MSNDPMLCLALFVALGLLLRSRSECARLRSNITARDERIAKLEADLGEAGEAFFEEKARGVELAIELRHYREEDEMRRFRVAERVAN